MRNYSRPQDRQEWCSNCGNRLPVGAYGICGVCQGKITAVRDQQPTVPNCPKCGWQFFNAWEQIQHVTQKRHEYRSWTPDDAKRAQDLMARRETRP